MVRMLADASDDSSFFFGYIGVAAALVFASKCWWGVIRVYLDLGAAYGTAKSGVGICSMGVLKPDLIMKSVIPVVMAGILGIYGMIVAVILLGRGKEVVMPYPLVSGLADNNDKG